MCQPKFIKELIFQERTEVVVMEARALAKLLVVRLQLHRQRTRPKSAREKRCRNGFSCDACLQPKWLHGKTVGKRSGKRPKEALKNDRKRSGKRPGLNEIAPPPRSLCRQPANTHCDGFQHESIIFRATFITWMQILSFLNTISSFVIQNSSFL